MSKLKPYLMTALTTLAVLAIARLVLPESVKAWVRI